MPDYPVLLNNLLQGQPGGNVAPHLHYTFDQKGPDNSAIHTATAVFRNKDYGVGRGTSRGLAKQAAAQATYEEFTANGVPEA